MSADPRWTDETRNLVAYEIAENRGAWSNLTDEEHGIFLQDADDVLTALADAGLLLPDGGETTQEWAVLSDSATATEQAMNGEDHARQILARYYTGDPTAYVGRRSAHYGPWQPAPEEATP